MSQCEPWGSNPDHLGPLGIDYFYIYYCSSPDLSYVVICLIFVWIALLMNLLAQTASNYLAPTLSKICEKLNLAYDIAGVTLLAFGNGAPDFFSLVASVTGGVDILVGVGALLGGSMFVCTIVVGTISILCPCEVSKKVFLRDISFHLFSVLCVTTIAIVQHIPVYIASCLLIAYTTYVIVVVFAGYIFGNNDADIAGDISLTTFTNANVIQTAFWHHDQKQKKKPSPPTNTNSFLTSSNSKMMKFSTDIESNRTAAANAANSSSGFTYSFLFLSNEDSDNDTDDNATETKESKDTITKKNLDDVLTINLSGGFEPCFEDIIQEDYCDSFAPSAVRFTINDQDDGHDEDEDQDGMIGGDDDENGRLNSLDDSLSANLSIGNSLKQSLLGNKSRGFGGFGLGSGTVSGGPDDVNQRLYIAKGLKNRNSQRYQNILTSLYWQQWALRRKFRHSAIASEWSQYSIFYKLFIYCEYPLALARDLTIPSLEDDGWNKLYAMFHPMASPLLVCFVTGQIEDYVGACPLPVFVVIMGLIPSALIYLFATNSRAPSHYFFQSIWTVTAFVMCVMWIYLFADELITCLSSLGVILKLPPAFLGLTVLAWGNSVGDYFTNTAVARQGLGAMALAGCYGGPVFNILVGFGTALVYASSQLYPDSFLVVLDTSTMITLGFLVFTLSTTIGIVIYRDYKLDRAMGMYLISIYALYSLTQLSLLAIK
jgi:Ca2+/Na+ antiporter